MAIIKHDTHLRCYTVMNNTCLQDPNMSMKAKGLYAYLMSLPEDWVLHQTELKRHFKDGRDSIRTAVNELIENGYVTKVDTRNELGQIVDCTYTVYEEPRKSTENPATEKPITENPTSVNPSIQSTNINKVLNNTSNNNIYPTEKPKRTRKPFTTTYEQVLAVCIKNGFKGMNDTEGKLAEWFCKVALNEDGTVCYKGTVIKSYIGLVSILRSIDVSGKSYSKTTPSKRVRSTVNEGCF